MTFTDFFSLAWFFLAVFCAIAIHARDARIRGLEHHASELERICREALDQRDEARLAHDHLSERVGAYLKEATILVSELEHLKQAKKASDVLDSEDIISRVEEWLEGEEII